MDKHSGRRSPCDESMDSSRGESYATAGRSFVYSSISHYSEEEAEALAKRLDNDETFKEAAKMLIAWLESGECNERNSAGFYFLIQLCWKRVEKLQAEEKEYQEEIKHLKKSVLSRSSCIQRVLIEIEEIFSIIEKQNLVIYFTQNQVDDLHDMKADFFELKYFILKDSVGSDLQKVSDFENSDDEQAESNVPKLQAKLDSLTYELNTVHQETEKMQSKCKEYEDEVLELRVELAKKRLHQKKEDPDTEQNAPVFVGVASNQDQREMHLVTLISIFLFNHSEGANLDEIYTHLKKHIPINNAADVEYVLRKYPKIFSEFRPIFPFETKVWTCTSNTPETRRKLLNK